MWPGWHSSCGRSIRWLVTSPHLAPAVQRFPPPISPDLDQMLDASLNHASIMTWGWFNEGPSDKPAACPAYAACAARARARDPTRFGTWASSAKTSDACLEHASLVSFNSYPAWCALRPASQLHRP